MTEATSSDKQPEQAEKPKPPEQKKPVKKETSAKKAPAKKSGKTGSVAGWIAGLSLVVACAAVAATAYLWLNGQQQQRVVEKEVVQRDEKLHAQLAQQQARMNALQQAQEKSASLYAQTGLRLDEITETLGRDRHEWLMAEIRYTLRLANMRLQLFKDKDSALIALAAADEQIARLADPALHSVRALLSKEISTLRAVTDIDIEGASLAITALTEQVMQLSVRIPTREHDVKIEPAEKLESIEDWQKHAGAVWNELKTLVSIRRVDKKVTPLLTPDESQLLRQNLRLKLEIARVSLLQRDTGMFHNSLQESHDWIVAYFNTDRADVKAVMNKLDELSALEVNPTYPDISASLNELETIQHNKQRIEQAPVLPIEQAVPQQGAVIIEDAVIAE